MTWKQRALPALVFKLLNVFSTISMHRERETARKSAKAKDMIKHEITKASFIHAPQ